MPSISLNGKACVTRCIMNLNALRSLGSKGKEDSSVMLVSNDIGIKFEPKSESSPETLSILSSHGDKDCQTHSNTIVAVLEQEGHQMNANLVRASEANFTPGKVDSVKVQGGKDKHIGTE